MLGVGKLSGGGQGVKLDLAPFQGMALVEISWQTVFPTIESAPYAITLPGHAFYWFSLETPKRDVEERALAHDPRVMEIDGAWPLLFEEPERKELEFNLGVYLSSRHWFEWHETERHRRNAVVGASLVDVFRLPIDDAVLALVQLTFSDGESELFQLPLVHAEGERGAWN